VSEFQITMGGTAVVCCVHNREKRQVTDLPFNGNTHKPHLCACCENLFLRTDDVPHYCEQCGGRPFYPLGGPLPDPIGEV
jgi:hypothetical protein